MRPTKVIINLMRLDLLFCTVPSDNYFICKICSSKSQMKLFFFSSESAKWQQLIASNGKIGILLL